MSEMGHNSDAELKRRVDRRVELLEEITEAQDRLKEFKAEDKNDGFDEKAIAHVLKELRGGPEKQEANLVLEEVVRLYRRATGLPTTLEAAQAEVRKATETATPKKSRQRKDTDG